MSVTDSPRSIAAEIGDTVGNMTDNSHKSNKYDRQLRLWGDHGQSALEKASVCLIGATGLGSEILKNLVLPNIGSFYIVDHEIVQATDLGQNFFVTAQDIGSPRAEVVTRLLMEMNPDVRGDYLTDTLEHLMKNRPEWFTKFSLVITADIASESLLKQLSDLLYDTDVPLIVSRSVGMVGCIRIVVKEHHVMDTRSESEVDDLRLEEPFKELQDLADVIYLHHLSKPDHAHVPYVLLLMKYLDQYRKDHSGKIPTTYKEKKAFGESILKHRLKNDDGNYMEELNFEEASKAIVKVLGRERVPKRVQMLFDDPACENISVNSPPFWIIVRAIRDFVQKEGDGHLPHSGSLSDMHTDTESFVKLQKAYIAKAEHDFEVVVQKVNHLASYIGKPESIKPNLVKQYCKNASALGCIRTTSLKAEYERGEGVITALSAALREESSVGAFWYLMFRASDIFLAEYGRLPGSEDSTVETDAFLLKTTVLKFLKNLPGGVSISNNLGEEALLKYCQEMTRYGAEQVHSIAAFVGAVAGHEAIKFITGQYIPVNNTLIYDGISCAIDTLTV